MIDQIQQKFSELGEATQSRFPDDPNERNAGIGTTENLLAYAAAFGATLLAHNAMRAGWRTILDRDPPKNPASPEIDWKDALLWGAASGALVGIVRIASRRASSSVYNRVISRDP